MKITVKKLHDLLVKFDTAMLVIQGNDLAQHARPVSLVKIEPNCDVWFFTGRSPEKTREIKLDQKVLLLFQNDCNRYISLSGHAELVSDHLQMAAMWKESGTMWFPDDVTDPNPILIRVTSEMAEHWDASDLHGVKHFFANAKARITGSHLQIDDSSHHECMTLNPAPFLQTGWSRENSTQSGQSVVLTRT